MKNKPKIWYRLGFEPRVTGLANRNASVRPQRHSVSVFCCMHFKLEKAAQGVAQCEVSATRAVVDAAFRRIGKSRHGGHKSANISVNCQRI